MNPNNFLCGKSWHIEKKLAPYISISTISVIQGFALWALFEKKPGAGKPWLKNLKE